MEKTKIEWADATWNPVTGCYHDCMYCYARNMVHRFSGMTHVHSTKKSLITETLDKPFKLKDGKTRPYPFGFIPTFHRYKLDEYKNVKSKNIFVCSMADMFGEWVPDEWIEEILRSCEEAPQHRYLFLTKNPTRYVLLLLDGKLPEKDNMWYGISVTNKQQALRAETELSDMSPKAGAFISVEPLLEDVSDELRSVIGDFTDWVIIGAETGNRKGKVTPQPEWIHKIVEEAKEYNVPVFMKDSLIPIIGEDQMLREFPWEE